MFDIVLILSGKKCVFICFLSDVNDNECFCYWYRDLNGVKLIEGLYEYYTAFVANLNLMQNSENLIFSTPQSEQISKQVIIKGSNS